VLLSGGAIHWSVGNSDLSISGCIFDSNYAAYGGGAYIGDYHSGVLVTHSTFQNNIGTYGAGVYITQFNEGVLFVAVTVRGNAASAVGGGMYVLSADLGIVHCSWSGNVAPKSGALHSQAKTVYIDSTLIAGSIGTEVVVHLVSALSVVINSAQFLNNTGGGGSIGVTNCDDVSIWNCSFQKNTATVLNGGAILAIYSNVNVSNCVFINNTAQENGGAVHITDAKRVVIFGCVFDGNAALTGSGSAVWISSSSSVSIVGNELHNNRALHGGGTVYWVASLMAEPPGVLTANHFSENNAALYGSAVATDATALTLGADNVYNITDYTVDVPPITTYVVDYYEHVVRTESSVMVQAIVLTEAACAGYVTGGFLETVSSGNATFTSLLAYCDPGYSMPVYLSTTIRGIVLQVSFDLSFRECVTGEYYGDNICTPCESGTFSVTDPQSLNASLSKLTQQKVCLDCPDGSSGCHGNSVDLEEGYWRISDQAISTLSCPYVGSCKGGSGTGDELCTDGYGGKMHRYI
jgi:predicted outer membrane repeat protein